MHDEQLITRIIRFWKQFINYLILIPILSVIFNHIPSCPRFLIGVLDAYLILIAYAIFERRKDFKKLEEEVEMLIQECEEYKEKFMKIAESSNNIEIKHKL